MRLCLRLGSRRSLGPFLRVQDGLQLGGSFEAGVVGVFLVEVVVGLRAELGGELFEDAG